VDDDVAGTTCRTLQIMLATSCGAMKFKKRGSVMWRMTWQALRVRPCHETRETRVCNVKDDVAGSTCRTLL